MKAFSAVVVTSYGADVVYVRVARDDGTEFPCPILIYDEPFVMKFEASAGHGVEFCRRELGIEPEMVSRKGG